MKFKSLIERRNGEGIVDQLKRMGGDDLMDLARVMNRPDIERRANLRTRDREGFSDEKLGMMRSKGFSDRDSNRDDRRGRHKENR